MENEEMNTTPSAENNSNGMPTPTQTQTQPGATQMATSAQTTTPSAQTKENPASGQLKNATLLYDVNKGDLDENGNVVGGNTALYFGDPSKKAEASQLAMKSILANNGENLERTGMAPADGGASAGFKAGSYTANAIADLQEDASRRKLGRTYAHDKIVTDALVGIYKTFNGYGETIGTVVNSGGRKIAGIEREACEAVNQQLKQNGAEYRVVGMSVENGTNGKPLFKVYTVDKNGNKHIDIRTGDQVYDIRKTALADAALGVRIKGEKESDRDKRRAELLASDSKTGMPSAIERRIIEELGDIKYAQGAYREKNAESIARAERDKASALASDTEQAIAMAKSEREDKRMERDAEQMEIDTRLKEAKIKESEQSVLNAAKLGAIEMDKAKAMVEQIKLQNDALKKKADSELTKEEADLKTQFDNDMKELDKITDVLKTFRNDETNDERIKQRNDLVAQFNKVRSRMARRSDEVKFGKLKIGETMTLANGSIVRKGQDGRPIEVK